jgi:hypothetical protein
MGNTLARSRRYGLSNIDDEFNREVSDIDGAMLLKLLYSVRSEWHLDELNPSSNAGASRFELLCKCLNEH